ncbi:MAG: nucleotidyltransferase domain-containing protein [Candidatus Thermoplasmatota archaeon]|nr:nucleotidyltransferase domain-containing protein [Candidatus Thermoplasmatota archaeon]
MLTPLDAEEFQSIIAHVISELERKYQERLLYVAAKGSIARGTETPISDIDLIAVADPGGRDAYEWLYHSTPVDVVVYPLEEVKERILNVDGLWPHEVGSLLVHRVYVDRGDVHQRIRGWHEEALREDWKFREACEFIGFFEYFSKVQRAVESDSPEVLRYAAWEIFFMSCMNLALLNKRFYYDHTTMTDQIEQFDFVPTGFLEKARDIFRRDQRRVFLGARALFEINLRLAKEFGFERATIADVGQIRVE